jgi:hypothetical protein
MASFCRLEAQLRFKPSVSQVLGATHEGDALGRHGWRRRRGTEMPILRAIAKRQASPRRLGFRAAIGSGIALLLLACSAHAQGQSEWAVKATYLYKFAPFVTWPADPADNGGAPFTICVVGDDPFGASLDQAVAGQSIDGKQIVVRRMAKADRTVACPVLYAGGDATQVKDTLQAVDGAPDLTVTNGTGPAGVVDFVADDGQVRFRLDDDAAAKNGLVISSKLLNLAISVKRRKAAP